MFSLVSVEKIQYGLLILLGFSLFLPQSIGDKSLIQDIVSETPQLAIIFIFIISSLLACIYFQKEVIFSILGIILSFLYGFATGYVIMLQLSSSLTFSMYAPHQTPFATAVGCIIYILLIISFLWSLIKCVGRSRNTF